MKTNKNTNPGIFHSSNSRDLKTFTDGELTVSCASMFQADETLAGKK